MRMLIPLSDIEARVGAIDEGETLVIRDLIEDASALIESYCTRGVPNPVPDVIQLVCRRMVMRALDVSSSGLPTGLDSVQNSAGPFGQTLQMQSGSTDGGAWLTKVDRKMLRRWRGGAFSIPLK